MTATTQRVRIRHAGGSATIEVPPQSTVQDVAKLIEKAVPTITPLDKQMWKTGYPPRPVPTCRSEDAFVLTDDSIHVSLGNVGTIRFAVVEPELTGPDGVVVKRVMQSDNSCLFHAIGYVLCDKSLKEAPRLRQAVAKAVRDDPKTFTEAFLGKSPDAYIEFITHPDAWGGQIELLVFSRIFQTEIAAFDIIRDRVDIYGTEEGYKQRVFVMYDGIHYDALAFTFDEGLPADCDVTKFSPKDEVALQRAKHLCSEQHRKKAFTDTSSFTLRCIVCQEGLIGANDAEKHAQATGHQNFAEY